MDCDDRKRIHLFSARPRTLIALILTGFVVFISAIVAGLLLGDAYESSVPYQRAQYGRHRVFFSVSSKLPRDVHLLVSTNETTMIEVKFNFIGIGIDSSIQADNSLEFSDYQCSNITSDGCILPIVDSGKDCGSYKLSCDGSGDCDKIQIFGASTDEAMAHLKLRTQKKSYTTSFYVDAHISTEPQVQLSFESVTQASQYAELVLYFELASTFICCMLAGLFARKMKLYKWKSWSLMQKIFPAALLLFAISNWPYIYDWKPGSLFHLTLIQLSKWAGLLACLIWLILLFSLSILSFSRSPYQLPFVVPALVFSSFIALTNLYGRAWLALCSSNINNMILSMELISLSIFCVGILRNLIKNIYTEFSIITFFQYFLVLFNILCFAISLGTYGLHHISPIFMPSSTSSCVPTLLFYSSTIYSALVLTYILRPPMCNQTADSIIPEIELT